MLHLTPEDLKAIEANPSARSTIQGRCEHDAQEAHLLQSRVTELEARELRIREAAFHLMFNSMEARATIKSILNLAPQTFAESLVRLPPPET